VEHGPSSRSRATFAILRRRAAAAKSISSLTCALAAAAKASHSSATTPRATMVAFSERDAVAAVPDGVDNGSTGRASKTGAGLRPDRLPWRLVPGRLVDLPARHASWASDAAVGDRLARSDVLVGGRLDVDMTKALAGSPRMCEAEIAHAGASEPRDGERPISQSFVGRVDLGDAVAGRAVDLDLEAEGGDFAEGGERKRMQHRRAPAKERPDPRPQRVRTPTRAIVMGAECRAAEEKKAA
jgi:hypothetical protein